MVQLLQKQHKHRTGVQKKAKARRSLRSRGGINSKKDCAIKMGSDLHNFRDEGQDLLRKELLVDTEATSSQRSIALSQLMTPLNQRLTVWSWLMGGGAEELQNGKEMLR